MKPPTLDDTEVSTRRCDFAAILCLGLLVAAAGSGCAGEASADEDASSTYETPSRSALLDEETDWQLESERLYMSLPAVDADGTIYAGGWDGNLYSVEPDGTLNWRFATGAKIDAAAAVDASGRIGVGSWDGSFYLVGADGQEIWSVDMGAAVDASPSVDSDGRFYVASIAGRLARLEADGAIDWDIDLPAPATTSVSVYEDSSGLRAYVGTNQPSLECIEDGQVAGSLALDDQPIQDIALTDEGDAIVALRNGRLVRVGADCTVMWNQDFTYAVMQAPVIDTQGRAIAGAHNEQIYAIDLEDGSELWAADTRSDAPLLNGMHVGDDGNYYGGVGAIISVSEVGNVEVLAEIDAIGSPVVTSDGAFTVTERGELVKLRAALAPLADTSWPTQHQNLQRTGYLRGPQ